MKTLCALILLACCPFAVAATYYVSYTHGSDSNTATQAQSKSTPWQHAPGMNGCNSYCSSTTINAGDSVILEGCVTWPNAAFSWIFPYAGSSGNPIYVGVDKTWWDSTASGCSSAWNRPIFNLGDAAPTDTADRIIILEKSYVTYDNFEMTNIASLPSAGNGYTGAFDFYDNSESYVTVEDMYIHGWVNPYFSVGTGNITTGSYTITNYVPYSYSTNQPTSAWGSSGQVLLQEISGSSLIPEGNNTPLLTAISGSNPYTITFSNTAGSPTGNCTGCVIELGGDFFHAFQGVEGTCTGCIAQNNIVDGSDTTEAQLNPYSDCGYTESNNQFCVSSGDAGWRQPNIWRGNVIQYISSAFVGECSEWSNNLIQDVRLSTNPTTHTNAIECLDETASNNLYYNNVERHTNNPNPNVPGGQWSIGLFNQLTPESGYTDYVFNNVVYDGLQNAPWGLFTGGSGCCGSLKFFNNTGDGGPVWTSENYDLINSCPAAYSSCLFESNHLVSNISSSVLSSCGSNCTHTTNLVQSFATASGQGYTASETFAYSPTSGSGSTVGTGTNAQSLCTAISGISSAAGTACQNDTGYACSYNTSTHTVNCPDRTANTRPSSAAFDVGAYQFSSGSSTPGAFSPLLLAADRFRFESVPSR